MDWKSILSTAAPWIGTAIGGPLGGLAITAAANALGLSDKTEEAVRTAIMGASPEDLAQLKLADQQFAAEMQRMAYEHQQRLEEVAAADRANARTRQADTNDPTPRNLAYILVLGALGLGAGLLFGKVELDSTLVGVVIGYIFNEAGGATSFFFGESKKNYRGDVKSAESEEKVKT